MAAVYCILGLFGLLYIFQVIVVRIEKYMIWPYGQPQESPQYPDPTGYGAKRLHEAVEAGFGFLGWAPDLKGKNYRTCYAMLVSPDQTCYVLIGIGKVLTMPVQGTWIYSVAADHRVFYSTDHQSCIEMDLSKSWIGQLSPSKNFTQLWERHTKWLGAKGVECLPFSDGREIEEFRSLRNERVSRLWDLGLISFVESSHDRWRYTTRAAMKMAFLSYTIGLMRGITSGRFPRSA